MRKSGWAAVAGLGTAAVLLTACGGSSSTSTGGSTSTPTATNAATQPAGQPSSAVGLAKGTTVLIIEHTKLGYVLALSDNGKVVYTYSGDKKGGTPTCAGACAAQWPAVTGNPQPSAAITLPGTLGTVTTADGAKQVTYNGMPLYILKGEKPFGVTGNGGSWHVVMMSKSDIKMGA
jgi:predicted lipoprotein with Yx(FWY)xxD motif